MLMFESIFNEHKIGNSSSVYLIAEIGLNHNGCVSRAKQLMEIAKESGCSAVKFQKRSLEDIYISDLLENLDNYEQGFQYLIPILSEYEFSIKQMTELKQYADELDIDFLCTPFDEVSAEYIHNLGVKMFKVASADFDNYLLLEKIISFNKPLLLSTGMSSFQDIDHVISFLRGYDIPFLLFHCVSSYPVKHSEANITRIKELKDKYKCLVGYSGHDEGIALSVAAVAMGAVVIEKHITLDKGMRGPDHKFSLLPHELQRLVSNVNQVKASLSSPTALSLQGVELNKTIFRKSLVAKREIPAGSILTADMIAAKGPERMLEYHKPSDFIGSKCEKNLKKDAPLSSSTISHAAQKCTIPPIKWGKFGLVVRYHDFEDALKFNPEVLEFHMTFKDVMIEIPHIKFNKYSQQLKNITLRVHCCEYMGDQLLDLCSSDSSQVSRSMDILQRVVDITTEISQYFLNVTPLIIFNCGAMSLTGIPNSLQIDQTKFHQVFDKLHLRNTGLLAQNMPPYPWYFGGQWNGHYFIDPNELVIFCQETGQSICLDISHAIMACNYLNSSFEEYIQILKPYVQHIHVSDGQGLNGEGTQIGTGDIDFSLFFDLYSDYQGTWIPEIWQGHLFGNQGAVKALEKIHKILNPC